DNPRVANIGAVFFKSQPEYVDPRALDLRTIVDHVLDGLLGDELAHAVVNTPARQDHLRVIADHVGFMSQVIRVHADAVSTDQTRTKWQEIPFCAGSLQYVERVDSHSIKQYRQLVHQRYVEVALGVLDNLCGLRHSNARSPEDSGRDDALIKVGNFVERFWIVARHHFKYSGERVLFVSWIYALRRVANMKILLPPFSRKFLDDRNAYLFSCPRIDRRFVYDDCTTLQVPPN